MSRNGTAATSWVEICPLDRIDIDRGVAALVAGEPVAVFRLADGALFALDHREPFTGMPVMARGLVGSAGDVPTVASPLHKERFDLRTGACLDADGHSLRSWPVKVVDGTVMVASEPRAQATLEPLVGLGAVAEPKPA